MDSVLGQWKENIKRMELFLEAAVRAGASLVVFPECATTGYCFSSYAQARTAAQPIPGPATNEIAALCEKHGKCYAAFGMLEDRGNELFNAVVLIGSTGVIQTYRKIHLPDEGVDRFTCAGTEQFGISQVAGVRVGINICFDSRFPESSRSLFHLNADVILLPTNWTLGCELIPHCVVPTRAMENNAYYVAVNRVGIEAGFAFMGSSRICGPQGELISSASPNNEEIILADIDISKARNPEGFVCRDSRQPRAYVQACS